jgi:hypothetical protein
MPTISNKYALPLPLAILALAKEITKTSKVSKVLIPKIIKLKKPANKVDQLTKKMQKLSILYITLKDLQKAVNALAAAITNKMQLQY